ncbi:MAG TPA: methyltransferase domain-containing protein [Vicinamibacterales bacterium]|nr:methyltransferase domain-containing protein [Vicinamibacterales bacterium]
MTCTSCGLVFAAPMVAPTSSWYQLAYRAWHVEPEERWEYPVVLRELTTRDFVYEIGCGQGAFLAHCKSEGVAAFGIDFSSHAVETCQRRGLSAATSAVGMRASVDIGRQASTIAAYHVLEHLDRPDDLFMAAAEVAAEGATLWVSVPNVSRVGRVLDVIEPLDEPPHHLTKWTHPALEAIGRRNGWILESVLDEPFSWRAALYVVVSQWRSYQRLCGSRGPLTRSRWERIVRISLYPFAFLWLSRRRVRAGMRGFSMMARYRRDRELAQKSGARV